MASLRDGGLWAAGAVLVVGAVPAVVVLAVAVPVLVVGAVTAPVGLGMPLLVMSLGLVRAAADADRRLLAAAAGTRADLDVETVDPAGGVRERARFLRTDTRTWRSFAWLAVRSGAGLLVLVGLLVTAVVAVALLAVPFVDGYLEFGDDWRSTAGWSSAWTLPVAVALLVGVAHGFRLVTAAHLRLAGILLGPDPDERLSALRRTVERADARERLARDLHDGLGHALTLVVVQAQAAATALDVAPDAARAHLDAVTAAARDALGDLDRALDVLHGGAADQEPGLDDVPDLVRAARAAGLDVVLASSDADGPFPSWGVDAVTSEAAYRVVQEALTNALRHNGKGRCVVSVEHPAHGLRVVVRSAVADRAPRRSVLGGSGRGLTGLRDRVRATGGTLVAGPRDGEFVVEASWPGGRPAAGRAGAS